MSDKSQSFYSTTFLKLKKNKGAMLGLFIIIIAFLIAVFDYFISSDSTPYANRIILEIGGKKPGYRQNFLLLKKEDIHFSNGFFNQLAYGRRDPYEFIPITTATKNDSTITANKFIDEGISEKISYPLNKLASHGVITKTFYLGTDKYGRDILSRLLIGTRIRLSVGLITA